MRFSYNGRFWSGMGKVWDMILLSFYWLLLCIPVITIIPSTIALYYTAAKVLRKGVSYVTPEFFRAFRQNLRQGLGVSVLYLLVVVFLFMIRGFVDWQTLENNWGKVYYVFYLVFIMVGAGVTYYMLPVLSRFQVSILGAFRLSLYFGSRNLLTMVPLLITFAGAIALVYTLPITILVVPAFYAWLMTKPVEKTLRNYILKELPNPEEHEGMWYMEL